MATNSSSSDVVFIGEYRPVAPRMDNSLHQFLNLQNYAQWKHYEQEMQKAKQEADKKAEDVLMIQQMASCSICWNTFTDGLNAVSAKCGHLICNRCSQHIIDCAATKTDQLRALERRKPNRQRVYVRKVKPLCPMCRGPWSHLKKLPIPRET
uniref:RING-type domain-containing protein n=1 Tax=Caenorhabditis tropicalis TaxID=1561998 RepID=A0A1I7T643_9PELO